MQRLNGPLQKLRDEKVNKPVFFYLYTETDLREYKDSKYHLVILFQKLKKIILFLSSFCNLKRADSFPH